MSPQNQLRRFWLAVALITVGILGITWISITVINNADNEKTLAVSTNVFNTLMPVLSAWIGAILTYYFGSRQIENLQLQQQEAMSLVQQQAEQIRTLQNKP